MQRLVCARPLVSFRRSSCVSLSMAISFTAPSGWRSLSLVRLQCRVGIELDGEGIGITAGLCAANGVARLSPRQGIVSLVLIYRGPIGPGLLSSMATLHRLGTCNPGTFVP